MHLDADEEEEIAQAKGGSTMPVRTAPVEQQQSKPPAQGDERPESSELTPPPTAREEVGQEA